MESTTLQLTWFVLLGVLMAGYAILDGFDLSRDDAEGLIMQARLKAGWITEEDLAPPVVEEPAAEESTAPA